MLLPFLIAMFERSLSSRLAAAATRVFKMHLIVHRIPSSKNQDLGVGVKRRFFVKRSGRILNVNYTPNS